MMNFMQALIFFVPQFYKLFRNYPFPGILPTEHNPLICKQLTTADQASS